MILLWWPLIASRKNCGPQAAQKLFRPSETLSIIRGGKILIFFDEIRLDPSMVASDSLLKKWRPLGSIKKCCFLPKNTPFFGGQGGAYFNSWPIFFYSEYESTWPQDSKSAKKPISSFPIDYPLKEYKDFYLITVLLSTHTDINIFNVF